jgi:hypothetical protein
MEVVTIKARSAEKQQGKEPVQLFVEGFHSITTKDDFWFIKVEPVFLFAETGDFILVAGGDQRYLLEIVSISGRRWRFGDNKMKLIDPKKLRIFALSKNESREEITDLYWFEENSVHDFDGEGLFCRYKFEVFLEDD